jgi:small subunit ribosomal protein S16
MAVQIRLARYGAKKSAFYRIVVTDIRNPRDGRFIEKLGTFNPNASAETELVLDHNRLQYWRAQGAKPSPTLDRLLKKHPTTSATP